MDAVNSPAANIFHSFGHLVRGAWRATAGSRGQFVTFILLSILGYLFDLLEPCATGYTLGVFVEYGFTDKAFELGVWGIAGMAACRLASSILLHVGKYFQKKVAFKARMKTLEDIFSKLLSFPLSWHVTHHSGENLSRLFRSMGAIDACIGNYVSQITDIVVKLSVASIAIIALDRWVALNVIGMGAVTILTMLLFNKKLLGFIRRNNAFYDKLNRICIDYLFNIITVKSLRLERISEKYLADTKPNGYWLQKKISGYEEMKWGSVDVGNGIVKSASLLIYFCSHRGSAAPFNIAEAYVLLNYLDRIFSAVGSFTGYYGSVIESSIAYEDASKIAVEAAALPALSEDMRGDHPWETIVIKDLEFRYLQRERQGGIKAQNLEIKRGDKIALVGPSGGGKSTLLKVLGGMLIPERAVITNEAGVPMTIDRISQGCLMLPQEPEIFSENVRYNLTMGEKFKPEELHFYLSLCRAEEVLSKLPMGWDADLAEKGLNLSVGEKQRFAMTRGLLRAAGRDMLLLDEPTSSLDPMTEKQIFFGILHHFADRTIVTACHRLALVPLFDKIIYIRRGQIEEIGAFKELLDKRGAFFEAWDDYEKKVVQGLEL